MNAWSALLQGGTKLVYTKRPFLDCNSLTHSNLDVKINRIVLCSTSAKLGLGYGTTYRYPYQDSPAIYGVSIEFNDRKAGNNDNKKNTACHELGHAMGVDHNSSKKSCVNANLKVTKPGLWDQNTLVKSYGGDLSPSGRSAQAETIND